MTIRSIISQLISSGHDVQFRERTDGGVIITKLDGQSYSGAKGNAVARNIVGATLSEARKVQLQSIKPPKKSTPKSRKKTKVPETLDKLLRKSQRVWKKNEVNVSKGRITKKNVRWILEHEGESKAREALEKAISYAKGYAYEDNVNWLVLRMVNFKRNIPDDLQNDYQEIIDYLDTHKSQIKDKDLVAIYDQLYEIEKQYDYDELVEDSINSIKAILGI